MTYQDVIKDSKFYLPMNLNLGYLLENDTDIVILMNVINCDSISEKLSVRKLMRYTNRANNTIQQSLTRLRKLKLIEGFKPQYETLKDIFDSINNAKTIEERKKWCKAYQDSIQETVSESSTNEVYQELVQKTVSESGTVNVSETGTQIKKIEKEDVNKKDVINNKNVINEKIETNKDIYTEFQQHCDDMLLECKTEKDLISTRALLSSRLRKKTFEIPRNVMNRCNSYLDTKFNELSQTVMAEASTDEDFSFLD